VKPKEHLGKGKVLPCSVGVIDRPQAKAISTKDGLPDCLIFYDSGEGAIGRMLTEDQLVRDLEALIARMGPITDDLKKTIAEELKVYIWVELKDFVGCMIQSNEKAKN